MKKAISTDKAPAAIGPYSQAIEINGMIFTSGVIPVNPATGEIPEGVEAQADQAIKNLVNLLTEAGSSAEKVVKTTVFIKEMNGIYLIFSADVTKQFFRCHIFLLLCQLTDGFTKENLSFKPKLCRLIYRVFEFSLFIHADWKIQI